MVRQSDVIKSASSETTGTEDGVVTDPWSMGSVRMPKSIEDLEGVSPGVIAVLRLIWRYGKSNWTTIHQPEFAKRLRVSLSTVQRYISGARNLRLIESRKSTRKPRQGLGHLCEYRINWGGVYKRHGRTFIPSTRLSMKDLEWFVTREARSLPARFFRAAELVDGTLRLQGKDDVTYILPRDGEEVLQYVVESHYGRSIPDESLNTFVLTAGTVSPRLLELFCFALAYTATVPLSLGYYTTVLKQKKRTSLSPRASGSRSKSAKKVRTILVRSREGVRRP
jgi:hypothetical protein